MCICLKSIKLRLKKFLEKNLTSHSSTATNDESLAFQVLPMNNRDSVNYPERQVSSPPLYRVEGWSDSPELGSSKESWSLNLDFSDFKPCALSIVPPSWNTASYLDTTTLRVNPPSWVNAPVLVIANITADS